MATESVFSVRGIVRGYQIQTEDVPVKVFFLAAPDEPEIPIRLIGADIAMRDGHDVEVFYLHDPTRDQDTPLLVNNYSTRSVEELRERPLKKTDKRKAPGCLAGGGAFVVAALVLGAFFWPLLIGVVVWLIYKRVPIDKELKARNDWARKRPLLEAYIRDKYGSALSAASDPAAEYDDPDPRGRR